MHPMIIISVLKILREIFLKIMLLFVDIFHLTLEHTSGKVEIIRLFAYYNKRGTGHGNT